MNDAGRAVLLGLLLHGAACPAGAEEWKHEVAPYFMAAGMDGVTGIGDVTADVDVSFSDVAENLEMGFMGMYRGAKGPYSISLDAIYMDLEADKTGPAGLLLGDVSMQQLAIEADFGYQVGEGFEVFAGLRYNELRSRVQATGPLGQVEAASGSEDWVDPVVGARYTWSFADDWSLLLRGDIGGFGVGADFAWQGIATVRWQSSERVGWLLAYRYIDMDYEGSNTTKFIYDMAISGPGLGVVFSF